MVVDKHDASDESMHLLGAKFKITRFDDLQVSNASFDELKYAEDRTETKGQCDQYGNYSNGTSVVTGQHVEGKGTDLNNEAWDDIECAEEYFIFVDVTSQFPEEAAKSTRIYRVATEDDNPSVVNLSVETGSNGKRIPTKSTNVLAITNGNGVMMPKTGGIGTVIFYAAGMTLVLGTDLFFIMRRHTSGEG